MRNNSDLKFGAGQTSVDDGLYDAGLASELATEIQDSDGGDSDMEQSDDEFIDEGRDVDNDDSRVEEKQDDFAELRERNGSGVVDTRISNRESSYHARRHARTVNDTDTEGNQLTYQEIMENRELEREKAELEDKVRSIEEKKGVGEEDTASTSTATSSSSRWDNATAPTGEAPPKRRRRWDATPAASNAPSSSSSAGAGGSGGRSRWDETPAASGAPPAAAKKRSRWDATPAAVVEQAKKEVRGPGRVPSASASVLCFHDGLKRGGLFVVLFPSGPVLSSPIVFNNRCLRRSLGLQAALPTTDPTTDPHATMFEREMAYRNRPLTDAELDNLLPPSGYRILDPPAGYKPVLRISSNKKDMSAPTPSANSEGFTMSASDLPPDRDAYGIALGASGTAGPDGIPFIKQEDYQYFGKLMDDKNEGELSKAEVKVSPTPHASAACA